VKGICKLCDKEKDLIKKSHIIPEFMYQYLFDEKHKFILTPSSELIKENPKTQFRPTGDYEGGILCGTCDNELIGSYETYASKTIYSKEKLPDDIAFRVTNYHNKVGQSWSQCENVDYKKFKLFLLSILWRASISTRPLFSEVDLGVHENKLKEMLFNDNPGEESDYPVQLWTTVNDEEFPKDFVIQPRKFKLDGHRVYIFPISGLFILFFVSNHAKSQGVLEQTLRKNNSLPIIHIPKGQGWTFIAKYLNIKRR
jgi:hypothetical protein